MKKIFGLFLFFLISNVFSQEQFSVYFDSDKFELKKKETEKLNQWLDNNKESKIVGVYGFCDEDGSTGYNDTLAQKRIDDIFNKIKDKVKIREDFKTRNFGELHTLSKIKAENRKVTLFYILPKDLAHEEEILGIKKAIVVERPKTKPIIKYPEKLIFENPDGSKSEFKMDTIFMKKIADSKMGEKLKIDNLNFKINTFIVESQSRGKMYELLYVLKKNPSLKIEIQGHLCCMPVDRLDLSTQRAKAIYNFLINNGIEKNRLSYKGFGSTKPLFPLPEKDETERAANRRVEIEITNNE